MSPANPAIKTKPTAIIPSSLLSHTRTPTPIHNRAHPLQYHRLLTMEPATTTPRRSRFSEHFETPSAVIGITNMQHSETIRNELIQAEQTRDAMVKAIAIINTELDPIKEVYKDLANVLSNQNRFYASRGLPSRSPGAPPNPLGVQAAELGNRVEYLKEHKRLLEGQLGVWVQKVEELRLELLRACHMVPYVRPRSSLSRTSPLLYSGLSSSLTSNSLLPSSTSLPPPAPTRPPPPPPSGLLPPLPVEPEDGGYF